MAEVIHSQEIETIHRNLFRMAQFISERSAWTLPYNADAPLQKVRGLISNLQSRIGSLRTSASSGDGLDSPPELGFEQLPPSKFDGDRLYRFAAFLEDLDKWFTTRSGFEDPEKQSQVFVAIESSLIALADATRSLLETNYPDSSPSTPTPVTAATEAPPSTTGAVEHIERPQVESDEELEPIPNLKLVLKNTTERPLLQEFQGRVELTFEAKERLQAFLVEARAEMAESDQRRFEEKVLRWIEGTPDGQILILKSGAMDGPFKLYPIYRHKDDVPDQ